MSQTALCIDLLTLSGPVPKLCICNYFRMDLTPYFSHAIIRILTKNGKVSAGLHLWPLWSRHKNNVGHIMCIEKWFSAVILPCNPSLMHVIPNCKINCESPYCYCHNHLMPGSIHIFVKTTKLPKIGCKIFISMCSVFACLVLLSKKSK